MKQMICEFGKCTLVNRKVKDYFTSEKSRFADFSSYNIVDDQKKRIMNTQRDFLR